MKDGSEYIKNTIEGKGSKRKVKTNPSEGRIESTKGYKNYLKEVKHNLSRKERD